MKIVSLIIKLHSCKNFSGENFEFKYLSEEIMK